MEIKGEEFIKKVQLKQEENEIEQRLTEIKDAQSIYEQPARESTASILEREIQIQEEQEYSDIMLGKSSNSNEKNKKKYLVLGLILVILFLLTIIIIRLLTSDSTTEDSFSKSKNENIKNVLENENIEEQYQKIINEKLKNIKEEKRLEIKEEEIVDEKLNLKEIEEKEQVLERVKETKTDVFNVKKAQTLYKPTKKVAREEPKPKKTYTPKVKKTVVKKVTKSTKKTNISSLFNKPKGTFVQVGAFSKMPTSKYLSNITRQGFKYKIYKINIKNKTYHKLLIGPYNSRGQAKLATDNIKKKLNVSGAFILTF